MWIARNKNGQLKVFTEKPIRWNLISVDNNIWIDANGREKYGVPYMEASGFKYLAWEDEPIEVNFYDEKLLFEFISDIINEYNDEYHPSEEYLKDRFNEYMDNKAEIKKSL